MNQLKTKYITSSNLPLVIEPLNKAITREGIKELLIQNREVLQEALLKDGGILFRGFPIDDEQDFTDLIKTLKLGSFIDYIGGDSPRTKIAEGVYTSTEAPPSIKIPLHNELSYVKNYPKHIYFYCQIAPQCGGETIIADARKIYQSIDSRVKEKFIDKELRYVSCYYHKSQLMDFINAVQKGHRRWVDVFETEHKLEVERKCHENDFSYRWNQNDWIKLSQQRPATLVHPETGEVVWFNQAHIFDFNPKLLGLWRYIGTKILYCRDHMKLHQVFFCDGSPIPREDLYHILDVLDANTVSFPWQKGDLLVLDNILAMHGRSKFKGKRRILTAMTG